MLTALSTHTDQMIFDAIKRPGQAADRPAPRDAVWLFRVLERDDDGNPLDWGAVKAPTLADAQQLVTAHLIDVLGEDGRTYTVSFFEVVFARGVFATRVAQCARLTLRRAWD